MYRSENLSAMSFTSEQNYDSARSNVESLWGYSSFFRIRELHSIS